MRGLRIHRLASRVRAERAAALIVVLAVLLILVGLAVGILGRAATERRAAESFGAGVSARNLADIAVQMVQGQIHNATTQGIGVAWASQPGMVRAFAANGDLLAAYKLYSAADLISPSVDLDADLPPEAWKDQPAIWSDLNDPARLPYSFQGGADRPLVYPILDPRAASPVGNVGAVEGLAITAAPGFDPANPAAPGNNPAPMPVRWLYVLEDGSLIAPAGQTAAGVSFSGAVQPSRSNPIVGRIAFWTDDETAKVNINTAGEGTYWDTPRMTSTDDVRMGFYQPTRNEWQRYPGHPGTTSLSAVFPWRNLPAAVGGHQWELTEPALLRQREAVRRAAALSPVYRFGGSEAGTRPWLFPMGSATDEFFREPGVRPRQRLYASVDELIFDDDTDASAAERPVTTMLFQSDLATARELLESRRFFLTAHSRAPETNLFNLPRVSIWPVFRLHSDGAYHETRTTGFDRQIGRCASINGLPYFFQRENAQSSGDFSAIARNIDLLGYLDLLTSRPVPGFGSAFSGKYATADRRQILVSIADYIRSTNLFDEYLFLGDGSLTPAQIEQARRTDPAPTFTTSFRSGQRNHFTRPGHGLVVPSIVAWGGETYKGHGRFPTISEFGFHLIATADGSAGKSTPVQTGVDADGNAVFEPIDPAPDQDSDPDAYYRWMSNNAELNFTLPGAVPATQSPGTELEADEIRVQVLPLIELFDPMQGFTQLSLSGAIRIRGLGGLAINGQPLYAQNEITLPFGDNGNILYHPFDHFAGSGFLGFRYGAMLNHNSYTNRGFLVSRTVTVPRDGPLDFQAGPLTVEILGPGSPGEILQTIEIDFPSGELPVPRLVSNPVGQELPGFLPSPPASPRPENVYTGETLQIGGIITPPTGMVYPDYGWTGPSAHLPPQRFWSFTSGDLRFNTDVMGAENYPNTGFNTNHGGRLHLLSSLPNSVRRWKYPGIPGAQGSGALIIEGFDVVRTVYPPHGDFRLLDGLAVVSDSVFQPESAVFGSSERIAHTLREAGSTGHVPGFFGQSSYSGIGGAPELEPSQFRFADLPPSYQPAGAVSSGGFVYHPAITGDWDSGFSVAPDGPFINKPDEGNTYKGWHETQDGYSGYMPLIPYFYQYGMQFGAYATLSSPNRMIASPGAFGSISTGVKSGIPWRTLLFRPQRDHFGWSNPKDHLILDLFWMPVVEPYSISEPFSTAGKVNLNYQILPFTYIERSTGLHAVLKNERLGAVPNNHARRHKIWTPAHIDATANIDLPVRGTDAGRRRLDIAEILKQFQHRFLRGEIFRSASEVCEMHMVPEGESIDSSPGQAGFEAAAHAWAETFWANHRLTGENLRERIYATLYPRVTTKSNTFTVHVIAQSLRKVPGTDAAVWDETRDQALGEYRGSTTIERYVDPNNADIPDYATELRSNPEVEPLDRFYRWRVIQNRQFAL